MAGAVYTPPMSFIQPDNIMPTNYLIKNAEVINSGDLVGLDTNGFMVSASKTAAAVVKAIGAAIFVDSNGTSNTRTGDGATVRCAIARKGRLLNATNTLVPNLGKGKPVYLGPVTTSTVSNYTCTLTSTNGDAIQQVGIIDSDGTTINVDVAALSALEYQTAGNSIVNIA